jgi:hypothetical protein
VRFLEIRIVLILLFFGKIFNSLLKTGVDAILDKLDWCGLSPYP